MNITTGSSVSEQNEASTSQQIDTKAAQPCSLIVLARTLARRPDLPPHKRQFASLLLQQTYNYDANPDAMRPRILATIERIEGARA